MTKRNKRILIITAVTLCIVAVIVAAVSLYVHFSHKKVAINGVPYKEIMENTTIPTKQYDNLDLSKAFLNVPKADKLYSYYKLGEAKDIYTPDEAAHLCKVMFMQLFGYTESDGITFCNIDGKPQTNEQAWDPTFHDCSFYITYPEASVGWGFANVGLEGTLMFSQCTDYGVDSNSELVESINIGCGEQMSDKSYKLRGGEYKMADAVEFGSKALDSVKEYLPDADLQPARLNVFKSVRYDFVDKDYVPVEEYYEYQIEYEFVLDGIPVSDSYPAQIDSAETLFMVGVNKVDLVIDTPDKVSGLTYVGPFMLPDKESEPLEDNYLTLESACDLLSDYLAPQYMQHIDEITIKYVTAWDNTKHYGDDEKRSSSPCWCFITDQGYSTQSSCDYPCEKQLLVDMQTGDIFAYVGDRYESTLSHENDKNVLQQQLDEWDAQANGS